MHKSIHPQWHTILLNFTFYQLLSNKRVGSIVTIMLLLFLLNCVFSPAVPGSNLEIQSERKYFFYLQQTFTFPILPFANKMPRFILQSICCVQKQKGNYFPSNFGLMVVGMKWNLAHGKSMKFKLGKKLAFLQTIRIKHSRHVLTQFMAHVGRNFITAHFGEI